MLPNVFNYHFEKETKQWCVFMNKVVMINADFCKKHMKRKAAALFFFSQL